MSTVCIIQARLGSKRLPGKSMMKLNGTGKRVLHRVYDRMRAVNILVPGLLDDIIVATTNQQEDNMIEAWCKFRKVKLFRGEGHNVLKRFYDCAKLYQASWILRVTADCPFIDPVMVVGLLQKPRKSYQALAINRGGVIDGYDAELFSFNLLKEVYKKAKEDEHVTTVMRASDEDNKDYGTEFNFTGLKLSLDTKEDYDKLCKIAELLG